MRRGDNSSWIGFWKRQDRYQAWLDVADSASKTADGYALANKASGLPINHPDIAHWNKLFLWAYARAKKIRPEWVSIYGR